MEYFSRQERAGAKKDQKIVNFRIRNQEPHSSDLSRFLSTINNFPSALIQAVPSYSVTRIVTTVKSVIAREVFVQALEVKAKLWGGEFWGKGYFVNTVGQHGLGLSLLIIPASITH